MNISTDKKTFRVILHDGSKHLIEATSMDEIYAMEQFKDRSQTADQSKIAAIYEEQEPVFVLRAQDPTAAECILFWMAKNAATAPPEKLKRAFQKFEEFQRYDPDRKKPAD